MLLAVSTIEASEDEKHRKADLLRRRTKVINIPEIVKEDEKIRDLPRMDQHLLEETEGFWERDLGAFGSMGSLSIDPTRHLRSNGALSDRARTSTENGSKNPQDDIRDSSFLETELEESTAYWIRDLDESSMSMDLRRDLDMSMSMSVRFL